ncbi:MAG: hypothetical protein K0U98_22565 [Deltaproteobacteria bacterium]|nr:hypothetical protein [Deltaproteobacteria bacterium]
MPQITFFYGLALVLLGGGGYFGTGAASLTALIPVLFGLPTMIAGVMARHEHLLMHAMHGASILGIIAFLCTALSLPKALILFSGEGVERSSAVLIEAAMALLSGIFVALCVRSFIEAKKARKAKAAGS